MDKKSLADWLEYYIDLGVDSLRMPLPAPPVPAVATPTPGLPVIAPTLPKPLALSASRDLFTAGRKADPDLNAVRTDLGDCTRCKLHRTRTHIVFGSGSPGSKVMFVGEAPGADEDEQGLPFVGRAGQLLTKIIEAVGFRREEVYICNILKCRPPGNRNPETDEIAACEEFLFRQIDVIRPCILCALGTFAAQTLLRCKSPISQLRGQLIDYRGIKLVATFHPAYLLRNPNEKRKVWDDVRMLRAYYDQHCQ